jgi:hypothetical protein
MGKDDNFCWNCGDSKNAPEPELPEEVVKELELKARNRPSDVEVPPS